MFRRLLPVVLSIQMLLSLTAARPVLVSAASKTPETTETEEQPPLTEDGTYAPGEVIVMFRSGAVKDAKMSLSKAQALDNVDENFGETMEATGDADEAAMDAQSEAAILKSILGNDFVIRDSIAFDDDLTVALVSSDTYDTAAMIGKLSADDRIASAEANYYKEPQSYDYTYSLNDPMNAYNYQTNTPLAHNEAGPDTSARGSRAEMPLSTNAGSVRKKSGKSSSQSWIPGSSPNTRTSGTCSGRIRATSASKENTDTISTTITQTLRPLSITARTSRALSLPRRVTASGSRAQRQPPART